MDFERLTQEGEQEDKHREQEKETSMTSTLQSREGLTQLTSIVRKAANRKTTPELEPPLELPRLALEAHEIEAPELHRGVGYNATFSEVLRQAARHRQPGGLGRAAASNIAPRWDGLQQVKAPHAEI